jgi:hypothetical protein
MGKWGGPFEEWNVYSLVDGKQITVVKTYIDHFPTPYESRMVDERVLVDMQVSGDISSGEAAELREWIIGGMKTEIPEFLRIACNLEPKGERTMGEKIELGLKYEDRITDFSGIATARCEYLEGSTQVFLEPMAQMRADGGTLLGPAHHSLEQPCEGRWFIESRLARAGAA